MDHTGWELNNMRDKIGVDSLSNDKGVDKLINEISGYLETMVEDNLRKLVNRKDRGNHIHNSTNEFFRKRNRYRATKKLLMYLVRLINDLPEKGVENKFNPDHFKEFKKLVQFQSGLMQEPDVIVAMDSEFERMSMEKKINLWFYKGKIRSAYNKITGLIGQAEKPVPEDYHKLFDALGIIVSFWFYVRGEDESKVRVTDVYIFELLSVLKNKFPKNTG